MEENIEYWVWLQCCLGINNRRMKAAVRYFESPENMYRADETELRLYGELSERDIERLLNKKLDNTKRVIERCIEYGFGIIPYQSRMYPKKLAEITSPPIILYVKGCLPDSSKPYISIVGTRNPDETGRQLSYNFGYDIAKSNAVVVSGGAYGIDLYAHKGAVDVKGETICVLGCGLDSFENKTVNFIMNEIPEYGAVITEYPLGFTASRSTFPIRDRIISGISDCLVTVQAGLGSGALIAAKYAIQQNRKLFAVPGSASSPNSTGSNLLLKLGFSAALDHRDVLKWWYDEKQNPTPSEMINPTLSARQIKELSVKPEVLSFRDTDGRKLKSPIGYEQCVALDENLRKSKKTGFDERQIQLKTYEDKQETVSEEQKTKPMTERPALSGKRPETIETMERKSVFEEKMPAPAVAKTEAEENLQKSVTRTSEKKNIKKYDENKMYNGLPQSEIAFDYIHQQNQLQSLSDSGMASMFGTEDTGGMIRVKKENSKKAESKNNERRVSQSRNLKRTETSKVEKSNHKVSISKNEPIKDEKEAVNVKIKQIEREILSEQLTEKALTVYDTISDIPIHSDAIKLKTGFSMQDVLSSLTELDVMGYVKELPGRRYIRKS